jgi:hypothetical protein
MTRATAARFAFLLGIPVTAAGGMKLSVCCARAWTPPSPVRRRRSRRGLSRQAAAVWFLVPSSRPLAAAFVIYRCALRATIVGLFA